MKQQYPILLLVLFLALGSSTAFAQQRTLSGTIKDTQGSPLPGVNVIVKGTSTGTTSDTEGRYNINLNEGATTLVFSFIGFSTQEVEIGTRTSIDVTLSEDVTELNEVVVTALGIERSTRALQYSATQVNGDNFTQARENNLGASLSGRVAGVNVSKMASGPAGSSRVIIRGNKSLGGQSQPLYVVDGIPMDNSSFGDNNGQAGLWGGQDQGDGLSSINPDDIESITVLKGANAAALYGSRGGNGVISITTKKGTNRKGLGIELNSNFVAETVNNLSDLQTSYGTGAYQGGVPLRPTTVQDAFNWSENAWGPKFDPSLNYMGIDGVMRPYVNAGDNWDRFYKTGTAWTNSLAVTGGSDKQTFRFGVSDLRSDAVVPNSGYDRLNVSLNTSAKLGNKVTVVAKVIYSNEETHNRPTVSDSPGNAIQAIWRRPANINVDDLIGDPNKPGAIPAGVDPAILQVYGQGEDPKFEGQELLPAANNWGQNPWWAAYQHVNDDERDRIITSGQIRYDFTSWLYAQGRIGMDWFVRRSTQLTPEGVGYQLGGALNEGEDRVREINQEWTLGFNKTFNKIGVNAFVGGNKMTRSNERLQVNGNGFNVPFQPFINNAKQRNYTYDYRGQGINSLFASAEISYNSYLFLTATAREDWFSVLNPATNNVTYPSVGASFVFSDAFSSMPSWLSFGKVRASWAQVGIATILPYNTNLTYSLNGNPHAGFDGIPRTMGSFTAISQNNANIPNPDLKPTLSTEIEFGIDARFLDNRIGIDLTFYSQKTSDDILRATISRASGFGTTDVNVGELQNKGIEVLLTGTPVRGALTWDISLNLARNKNKVVTLLPGVKELILEEPRTRNVFIKHIVGEPFGMITGRVQQKSPAGQPMYLTDGRPLASADYVPIGNGVPDLTGGLTNSLTYKGINLSFLIDFKFGGDIFSGSNDRLTQWGLHKQSIIGRPGETPLHVKGVTDNNETPIDRDLTPDEARLYWNSVGGESTAISTMFLYDASYVKLRQLTLGYSLPRTLLSKTPFQKITISFVGRNLAILHKNIDNVDPESNYSANAGAQGLEYFGFPSTRSYGFNLGLGF
ncbi:SusC/RagA family TonB-linked outer membrane protein [Fulvivirgaceae bacterium PWU4]|uniref:SusC/RagA family TonB-linked outer membrane protein n=1 Tax=Chryseosolibacter histidini TaxID=2782349 RepID=A0AAP2DF01_9BACT|nr:SusC/RagA family TonB-linked outer membrane protein [Chryseosolibacter histidini]MBT1695283.1 SusC/RagA family TonB-linked outer membrane protein [Chryseosolibacter histidini]